VYDCVFPWTIGGTERWYRNLAERLVANGHQVTLLTMRHWPRTERPDIAGVDVVAVAPGLELYRNGRRRTLPPVLFGMGVLLHLLRHGDRYDVVHAAALSYFAVLAAAAVRGAHGYLLVTDWAEFWTRGYWVSYAGAVRGRVGWLVQRACARLPQRAFTFSQLHERRLRTALAEPAIVLRGLHVPPGDDAGIPALRAPSDPPVAVFAGRLIREKAVPALVSAVVHARARVPGLVLDVYGDGPAAAHIRAAIRAEGAGGVARMHGIVSCERLEHALSTAACAVLSSEREGYGVFLVEAMSHGCPVVVVRHPDNAAVELVEDGVNGFVVASSDPQVVGDAIAKAVGAGTALRRSTRAWYEAHLGELSIDASLAAVAAAYEGAVPR
jgi:glycosyltransferase involved in cell wall biosynthesis